MSRKETFLANSIRLMVCCVKTPTGISGKRRRGFWEAADDRATRPGQESVDSLKETLEDSLPFKPCNLLSYKIQLAKYFTEEYNEIVSTFARTDENHVSTTAYKAGHPFLQPPPGQVVLCAHTLNLVT